MYWFNVLKTYDEKQLKSLSEFVDAEKILNGLVNKARIRKHIVTLN